MATTTELQAMILSELNVSEDKEIMHLVESWWSLYTSYDSDHLRYLYTKRHAIAYLMGHARKKIDVTIGTDKLNASQEFRHLKDLYDSVSSELGMLQPGGTIAPLETTFPAVVSD